MYALLFKVHAERSHWHDFLISKPWMKDATFSLFLSLLSIPSASGNITMKGTGPHLWCYCGWNSLYWKLRNWIVFEIKGSIDPWVLLLLVSGPWHHGTGFSQETQTNNFLFFQFLSWKMLPHQNVSGSGHYYLVVSAATWKWNLSCLAITVNSIYSTMSLSFPDLSVLKHILQKMVWRRCLFCVVFVVLFWFCFCFLIFWENERPWACQIYLRLLLTADKHKEDKRFIFAKQSFKNMTAKLETNTETWKTIKGEVRLYCLLS